MCKIDGGGATLKTSSIRVESVCGRQNDNITDIFYLALLLLLPSIRPRPRLLFDDRNAKMSRRAGRRKSGSNSVHATSAGKGRGDNSERDFDESEWRGARGADGDFNVAGNEERPHFISTFRRGSLSQASTRRASLAQCQVACRLPLRIWGKERKKEASRLVASCSRVPVFPRKSGAEKGVRCHNALSQFALAPSSSSPPPPPPIAKYTRSEEGEGEETSYYVVSAAARRPTRFRHKVDGV